MLIVVPSPAIAGVDAPRGQPAAGPRAGARFDLHELHVADLAAVDDALGVDEARHEAVVEIDPELDAGLVARVDHALRVRDARRHRLVAEHVLARARGGDRLLGVLRVRRVDRDDGDVRIARAARRSSCTRASRRISSRTSARAPASRLTTPTSVLPENALIPGSTRSSAILPGTDEAPAVLDLASNYLS